MSTRLSVWLRRLAPSSAQLLGVTLARPDTDRRSAGADACRRRPPSSHRTAAGSVPAGLLSRAGAAEAAFILSFGAFNTGTPCRRGVVAPIIRRCREVCQPVGRPIHPARGICRRFPGSSCIDPIRRRLARPSVRHFSYRQWFLCGAVGLSV